MGKMFRFLVGAMLGAVVGAIIGVMLAPDSGAKTKATILDQVDGIIDGGRRAAAERRAELEAQFAASKHVPPRG